MLSLSYFFSAMEFLQQSDLLKIEDILPFFPDFVLIDDFKVAMLSICYVYWNCKILYLLTVKSITIPEIG